MEIITDMQKYDLLIGSFQKLLDSEVQDLAKQENQRIID